MRVRVSPRADRTFGAAISDININKLGDGAWKLIESALYEYGLLIIPKQQIA